MVKVAKVLGDMASCGALIELRWMVDTLAFITDEAVKHAGVTVDELQGGAI